MLKTSSLLMGLVVLGAGWQAVAGGLEARYDHPAAAVQADTAVSPTDATPQSAARQAGEARPPLGLTCLPIPEVVRAHLPRLAETAGVWIAEVQPKSPAAGWGLLKHDLVLALDRRPVADGTELCRRLVEGPLPSEITVLRGGEAIRLQLAKVNAEIEPFPLPAHAVAVSTSTPRLTLAMTSADGRRFHVVVEYADAKHGPCRREFQGPRERVGLEMRQLPDAVQTQIREQLDFRPSIGMDWRFQ